MLQKPLEHLGCQQGLTLSSQVVLRSIHSLPKRDLLIRENNVANKFQIHDMGKVYELYRAEDILLPSYVFLRFLPPLRTPGTEESVC